MPAAFLSNSQLYLERGEAATEEFVTPGALITSDRSRPSRLDHLGGCDPKARKGNNILDESPCFSPRSGRQRKAWGVSPRSSTKRSIEPAKRVLAVALNFVEMIRLPPASRALIVFPKPTLGLTPQALCCRPLRGLSELRF